MTKITVSCQYCEEPFEKGLSEFRRSERIGRKHYCSMKCYGKDSAIEHIPNYKSGNMANLMAPGWQQSDLSPFKIMFNTAKTHARNKRREFLIVLEDLKEQWELQYGVCPLTGWKMVLPKNSAERSEFTSNRASIDRIDSNKGYVKGNIRFVSLMAQYAKHKWADADVIAFARAVTAFNVETGS